MKTQIRLNSVVPNGVSGPESTAINLIYEYLLAEYNQNTYRYISINQIGSDLNEVMIKDGRDVYLNIRYLSPEDFTLRTDAEKNRFRLEVMHKGLKRIAENDKKLDESSLDAIKTKILANDFSFDFPLKTYKDKKDNNKIAKLIVHPESNEFKYYIQFENKGVIKTKLLIYNGITSIHYVADLFQFGKWKDGNHFIISGKEKGVEIHVLIDDNVVDYLDVSASFTAKSFEMFKSHLSVKQKENALKNFENSLPLSIKAIISKEDS